MGTLASSLGMTEAQYQQALGNLPVYQSGSTVIDPVSGNITSQATSIGPSVTFPSVTSPDTYDSASQVNAALPDPLLSLAYGNINGLPSASTTQNSSSSCAWYDVTCELNAARNAVGNTNFGDTSTPAPGILGGLANAAGLTVPGLGGQGSALQGITWGRVGAFLLALIMIAGGLYLFGQPSITNEVRSVARRGLAV